MIELAHPEDDSDTGFATHLPDEDATAAAGAALAPALHPGLVIYLTGDLGAGKTTLVRGLLRALGHTGKVRSPTYSLIEPYTLSRLHLYHFDFYRFAAPDEYLEAGLEEYFLGDGVCLVEWPDKAQPFVAKADVVARLAVDGSGRRLEVKALTEAGRSCTRTMKNRLQGMTR